MSIADKLVTIAENEQKVYEAGISTGIEADKKKLLTTYLNHHQIYSAVTSLGHQYASIDGGTGGCIRFTPRSEKQEAYCDIFKDTEVVCGKYIAIKYRSPYSNSNSIEVWVDTENTKPTWGDHMTCKTHFKNDNEWNIVIFDAQSYHPDKYTPNKDGTYTFKYLRLDTFNSGGSLSTEADYLDVEYIATATSIEKILACNKDIDSVVVVKGNGNEEEIKNEYAQTINISNDSNAEVLAGLIDRSITSIEIPYGVTSIGDYAFQHCKQLAKVTIPNTVTVINAYAFNGCSKLTQIIFGGTMEQWGLITKYSYWNQQTGKYTVTCTDGTISK